MGSFYSSIVANLLPRGVGRAVAGARGPRVYVPNLGHDPESLGLDVFDAASRLVHFLQRDVRGEVNPSELLHYVLVDSNNGAYPASTGLDRFEKLGIRIVDRELVTSRSKPLIDEDLLIEALMSLI